MDYSKVESQQMSVDLSKFDNSWYSPGRPTWVQGLWFFLGLPLLRSSCIPSSGLRRCLLRLFGARIGKGVIIKPGVRVKYPWLLQVGDHTWIGEDVWIDNLAPVQLGSNVCISQGVYLCTGNHDWTDPSFGLMLGEIVIENGAWLGAKTVVGPGANIGVSAVASAGSVVVGRLDPQTVYAGNPAIPVRARHLRTNQQQSRVPHSKDGLA